MSVHLLDMNIKSLFGKSWVITNQNKPTAVWFILIGIHCFCKWRNSHKHHLHCLSPNPQDQKYNSSPTEPQDQDEPVWWEISDDKQSRRMGLWDSVWSWKWTSLVLKLEPLERESLWGGESIDTVIILSQMAVKHVPGRMSKWRGSLCLLLLLFSMVLC